MAAIVLHYDNPAAHSWLGGVPSWSGRTLIRVHFHVRLCAAPSKHMAPVVIEVRPIRGMPGRCASRARSYALGLLYWVPLQQGRSEGIELKLLRSRAMPCFVNLSDEPGRARDFDDLAQTPQREAPIPCEAWSFR
jgi:hypothetical protein